jgi:predicted phage terminase large subunit-like protein
MQQRPSPEEGGIIKKAWLGKINRDKVPNGLIVHFQLDTAYTESLKNDPTAVIAYYIESNKVYIVRTISVWKEFPDLITWLPEFVKGLGYNQRSKIYVEPKASGKSVVQTIRKTTNLNIIESEAPKDDKLTRVHTVSPKIEAGRVFLHEGPWNDAFISQLTTFPNAEHDDEVDCLTAIVKRELMTSTHKNNYSIFK